MNHHPSCARTRDPVLARNGDRVLTRGDLEQAVVRLLLTNPVIAYIVTRQVWRRPGGVFFTAWALRGAILWIIAGATGPRRRNRPLDAVDLLFHFCPMPNRNVAVLRLMTLLLDHVFGPAGKKPCRAPRHRPSVVRRLIGKFVPTAVLDRAYDLAHDLTRLCRGPIPLATGPP